MDKSIYAWFYKENSIFDSNEPLDINLSFDDNKIKDIIYELGKISLTIDDYLPEQIKSLEPGQKTLVKLNILKTLLTDHIHYLDYSLCPLVCIHAFLTFVKHV